MLVHSAAGGVGSLAVQLAHHLGASRVIATASTASKLALASRLGATDTVNYTEPGWADRVLDLTDGRGVDVVIEAVGGDIGEESLRILADNGRLVVYGVASKRMSAFAGSQLMQRNQAVLGYWLTSRLSPGSATAEIVPRLLQLADAGELTAIVQHVFPLEAGGRGAPGACRPRHCRQGGAARMTQQRSMAVVGAGVVGQVYAGRLAEAGHRVHLIARGRR